MVCKKMRQSSVCGTNTQCTNKEWKQTYTTSDSLPSVILSKATMTWRGDPRSLMGIPWNSKDVNHKADLLCYEIVGAVDPCTRWYLQVFPGHWSADKQTLPWWAPFQFWSLFLYKLSMASRRCGTSSERKLVTAGHMQ